MLRPTNPRCTYGGSIGAQEHKIPFQQIKVAFTTNSNLIVKKKKYAKVFMH
jgi:hypothetical protein